MTIRGGVSCGGAACPGLDANDNETRAEALHPRVPVERDGSDFLHRRRGSGVTVTVVSEDPGRWWRAGGVSRGIQAGSGGEGRQAGPASSAAPVSRFRPVPAGGHLYHPGASA
ncbi:MAG: hypothetical protein OXF07_00970 [Rhodobacter sp.]|nr:hypothetical protein [Rhodobacter sp.]MCY4169783.1 hypothetical protein [Rhodobacter sp.]MCY4241443.1 hypothetical protein [Rhodobacter sp.]